MRPRAITAEALDVLREMKRSGASYQTLADFYGCGKKTVIDAFNGRKPARPARAEHPDRITVMTAHNGGCSTTSGMMPVTLPRLRCLETRVAANDNRLPEMAVAA
ncbi:hypothetical protein SAMN03159496_04676 [Rhizobium sp. NFR07]|uniref:hypothetical protein n=1 Tax=Rhizobium sp. NFR07 TaxID=1566262 RepID=UPI0008E2714A|nr:hypothetical protein [Rhizobium sp. NFR07]SFB52649.1 hypothetical protein SAMN03159496_04676 [Rhizobium sp. NFR07]